MDPTDLSLVDMAGGTEGGAPGSVALVEAHLARIRAYPRLNAVVTLDADRALARAAEADDAAARGERWGPLHGVPFTLKDMHETAGVRTTAGLETLADHVPTRDGPIAELLIAAGGILLGKTNMAMNVESDNDLFGRPRNPYDLERSAGGSSGGAAAALAARLTPLDVGTDLSGSIRMPAHFCGVVGLKPTLHRIPATGVIGGPGLHGRIDRWLCVSGPMARSVGDVALAFSVLARAHPEDPEIPPLPVRSVPARRPDQLRLLVSPAVDGMFTAASVSRCIESLADQLAAAGAEVAFETRPVDYLPMLDGYRRLIALALAAMQRSGSAPPGSEQIAAAASSGAVLLGELEARDQFLAGLHARLDGYDAWLCPAAPLPAFRHRERGQPVEVEGATIPSGIVDHYSVAATYSGCPAIVLPAGSDHGLPIGVQLIGRKWQDEELLATAAAVESVAPPIAPPALGGRPA